MSTPGIPAAPRPPASRKRGAYRDAFANDGAERLRMALRDAGFSGSVKCSGYQVTVEMSGSAAKDLARLIDENR